jgi:hypothetical protein
MVQLEILEDALALHIDHGAFMVHEILNSEIIFERIVDAIEAALLEAGEIERGFSQRFAGNCAGVDATSAHVRGAVDDGDALAKIGGLGASFFAGGAAADYDQVEIFGTRHANLPLRTTRHLLKGACTLRPASAWALASKPVELERV